LRGEIASNCRRTLGLHFDLRTASFADVGLEPDHIEQPPHLSDHLCGKLRLAITAGITATARLSSSSKELISYQLLEFGKRNTPSTANCSSSGLGARSRASPSTWSSDVGRQVIAAMDLFIAATISFDRLYAFVIVRLDRRSLVSINVTTNPTAEWIALSVKAASSSFFRIPL